MKGIVEYRDEETNALVHGAYKKNEPDVRVVVLGENRGLSKPQKRKLNTEFKQALGGRPKVVVVYRNERLETVKI